MIQNKYINLGLRVYLFFVFCQSPVFAQKNTSRIDSLKQILQKVQKEEDKIDTYLEIIEYYLRRDPKSARKYIQITEKKLQKLSLPIRKVRLFNQLGTSYYIEGKVDKALIYFIKTLEILKKNEHKPWLINTYNNLAAIYLHQSNESLSLEYYLKALEISESLEKSLHQRIHIMLNIATLYENRGNYDLGLKYVNKALKLNKKHKDPKAESSALNLLGLVYKDKKEYKKSLDAFKKAYQVALPIQNQHELSALLVNLATIYILQDDYDKADESLREGLNIADKYQLTVRKYEIYQVIAALHKRQKNYPMALSYSLEAYKFFEENHMKDKIEEEALNLSEIYTEMKDFEKALEYRNISAVYKDSLLNETNIRKMEAVKYNYEIDKKERQNQLLNKDKKLQKLALEQSEQQKRFFLLVMIALFIVLIFVFLLYRQTQKSKKKLSEQHEIIQDKKQALEKANQSKDQLFALVAHDLRSPIAAYQGLSEQINFFLEQADYSNIQQIAYHLEKSSKNLSILLDNLLNWALLQKDTIRARWQNFNLYNLAEEWIFVYENMAKTYEVNIHNQIPKDFVIYSDRNLLSTILRNLLNNALKFTPKNGNVYVKTHIRGNYYQISVSDTGVGMKQEIIEKIYAEQLLKGEKGLHGETSTGLGLRLCFAFAKILQGTINIESELQKGTSFSLDLPKKLP